MSSFRLIPTFRLARRLAKEVAPRGFYDHWGMRPWIHRGWGHPSILPTFGPQFLNRMLDEHLGMFENLNRIVDLSAESFWCEDDQPSKERGKHATGKDSSGFGQEVSSQEEKSEGTFKVSLKVGDAFKPEEIKVKVFGRCLQIEGKHETRDDNGHYVHRHFAHSYNLPMDVDDTNFVSTLTAEGILNVEAPRLQQADVQHERHIPIQQEPQNAARNETEVKPDANSADAGEEPNIAGEKVAEGDTDAKKE